MKVLQVTHGEGARRVAAVEVPAPTPTSGELLITCVAAAGVLPARPGVSDDAVRIFGGAGLLCAWDKNLGDRAHGERLAWCSGLHGSELGDLVCVTGYRSVTVPEGVRLEDAAFAALGALAIKAVTELAVPQEGARVAVLGAGALASLVREELALRGLETSIEPSSATHEIDCARLLDAAVRLALGDGAAGMHAYLEDLAAGRRVGHGAARAAIDWRRASSIPAREVVLVSGRGAGASSSSSSSSSSSICPSSHVLAAARRLDMPAAARPARPRSCRLDLLVADDHGARRGLIDGELTALATTPSLRPLAACAASPWVARHVAARGDFASATTDPALVLRGEHDVLALWGGHLSSKLSRSFAAAVSWIEGAARPRVWASPGLVMAIFEARDVVRGVGLEEPLGPGVWIGFVRRHARLVRRARALVAGRLGPLEMRLETPVAHAELGFAGLGEWIAVMRSCADAEPVRVSAADGSESPDILIEFADGSRGRLSAVSPAELPGDARFSVAVDARRATIVEARGGQGLRGEFVRDGRTSRARESMMAVYGRMWAALGDSVGRPEPAIEMLRARADDEVIRASAAVADVLLIGEPVALTNEVA